MKKHFVFTLEGRDWWKPFLLFWVVSLLLFGGQQVLLRRGNSASAGLDLLLGLVVTILLVLLEAIFTPVLMRIVAGKISFDGNAFSFDGSTGRYVALNLKGVLLSIITVGFYAPWYLRNVLAWLAGHTSYRGTALQFLGNPRKLLKYFVLALYVPMIVVIVGLSIAIIVASMRGSGAPPQGMTQLVTAASTVVILFLLIPLMYLTVKWYIDVQWTTARVALRTAFWPACGFVLGQVLLTVITAGIYSPAAYLRLYRYFVGRTIITSDGARERNLGFDGSIGRGFGLLWGQALLCLVTAGFYSPWASARVARWLLGATFIEQAS